MRTILYLLFLFIGIISIEAQSVLGKWKTVDSETGKTESIVEIYKEGDKLFGKVIEILNPEDKNKTCTKCKGKDKDKPIEGLVIIQGLEKDGDEWNNGKILDPKNGKKYSCYIQLITNNKLKLRGYIGFSIAGRTEYWYRN